LLNVKGKKKTTRKKMMRKLVIPLDYFTITNFQLAFYIRRKHILEDTLYELEKHNSLNDNVYRFRIEFVNEPGVDQGGLKKEWLTLLSKEIFDPRAGLFKLSPNMRSVHPSPLSLIQPGAMSYFSLAGVLVGLVRNCGGGNY